jgi:hypothetical protein
MYSDNQTFWVLILFEPPSSRYDRGRQSDASNNSDCRHRDRYCCFHQGRHFLHSLLFVMNLVSGRGNNSYP